MKKLRGKKADMFKWLFALIVGGIILFTIFGVINRFTDLLVEGIVPTQGNVGVRIGDAPQTVFIGFHIGGLGPELAFPGEYVLQQARGNAGLGGCFEYGSVELVLPFVDGWQCAG